MADRIDTIKIFVAVAELESFAKAARRFNRTPAAVTRAVASLEDELRTRLFNRTTRSVVLTDDGGRYLQVCRRLLTAFAELEAADPGDTVEPHGRISVTAPAMFGRLHVLPSVAGLIDRYPQLDVCALLLDRVVSLVDEGIDVGVRLGRLPDSSLRGVLVGHVYMGVYGHPDYLASRGTPSTPHDLRDHRTISCSAVTQIPERWSFQGAGGVGSVSVKPSLVVNTTDGAADAAASGLGLTYLISYQVDAHVRAGTLIRVLAEYEQPAIPIHIVHPSGRFLSSKVRLFIDHLSTDLRRKFGST